MGDPAQFPAIELDIFDTFLRKKFDIIILKDVKRQDDKAFQTLLTTVHMGKTTPDINSTLASKLLPIVDSTHIDLDDPRAASICSLRKERDVWNKLFLGKLDTETHTFEAQDTDITGNPIPDKEKRRIRWFHRERLEDTLTLKVCARVVLCKNIDTENGWLNGTLATVTKIERTFIVIQHLQTHRQTVITRMKQNVSFPGSPIQYVRTQCPLILGWALTVHKVQGMTLQKAYIQLNTNVFASDQAYVAISRVKSLDDLYLLDFDPKAIYLDAYYKSLLQWMTSVDKLSNSSTTVDYPTRQTQRTTWLPCKKIQSNSSSGKSPVVNCTTRDTRHVKKLPTKKTISNNSATSSNSLGSDRISILQVSHIFPSFPNLEQIWQTLDLPLHASKESYIHQYHQQFEDLLDILRTIDTAMFHP